MSGQEAIDYAYAAMIVCTGLGFLAACVALSISLLRERGVSRGRR